MVAPALGFLENSLDMMGGKLSLRRSTRCMAERQQRDTLDFKKKIKIKKIEETRKSSRHKKPLDSTS